MNSYLKKVRIIQQKRTSKERLAAFDASLKSNSLLPEDVIFQNMEDLGLDPKPKQGKNRSGGTIIASDN